MSYLRVGIFYCGLRSGSAMVLPPAAPLLKIAAAGTLRHVSGRVSGAPMPSCKGLLYPQNTYTTVALRRKIELETTQQYENTPNEGSCVPKSA